MPLLDKEGRFGEHLEDIREVISTARILSLLSFITVVGVVMMVIGFLREKDEVDSPSGFRKITDPEQRRLAAMFMDTGDLIDLDLNEGESATLPSGDVVEKTADGFIIKYR